MAEDPKQIRFVVRLGKDWTGEITCQQDNTWRHPLALERLEHEKGDFPRLLELRDDGSPPVPLPLHDPPDDHAQLDGEATADEIRDLYDVLLSRTAQPAQVRRFGHYLFDALLGHDLWATMEQKAELAGATFVELALSFPVDDQHLQRLHWEMMRSKRQYLAAQGDKLDVAITRVVDKDVGEPQQLEVPPRVLFVIGSSLTDEKIRPGAELYALLRQARDGRGMRYRVLQRATSTELRRTVEEFRPEIVHFICHGDVDGSDPPRVFLRLETDQKDQRAERYADDLLHDLCPGGWRPTVVVLSACFTAGTAESPRFVLAGVHQSAPLAAALVDGGIPIVFGMSGRIADVTSRLFARRLTETLIKGKPLVLATALARQVAFTQGPDPEGYVDWAFPAIFLAGSVGRMEKPYKPVNVEASNKEWLQLEAWIDASHFNWSPVFCGRDELLAAFHRMFERGSGGDDGDDDEKPPKQAIALIADRNVSDIGCTRLLREMGAQAFRDRHLPLLLTFESDLPHDLRGLVQRLAAAIRRLRNEVLVLDPVTRPSQLSLLFARNPDAAGLDESIAEDLRLASNELTNDSVRTAAQADLGMLLRDARDKHPSVGWRRVVVLLDDIDQYGSDLTGNLLAADNGLLRSTGLGTSDQPIPVVMTCRRGGPAETRLKALEESPGSVGWLEVKPFGPFRDDGEDILACQAVLLNPFHAQPIKGVNDIGWAINDDVSEGVKTEKEYLFRTATGGIPGNYANPQLFFLAAAAKDSKYTVQADDENRLRHLLRQQ